MHIYVVRHTSYSNPEGVYAFHLPFNLSEEGRAHAQNIGDWFKENTSNKIPIYSSPIVRCVQTSEIIASKTNSFVVADERLIETSSALLQGAKINLSNREEDNSSRESKEAVLKRMLDIFEEKITLGEDCLLISHGDLTTLLNHHLRKIEVPKYLWTGARPEHIINKGDILDIEIENKNVKSIKKIDGLN